MRAKIAQALAAQVQDWTDRGTEPRFIPHPTTWLNGRRWEDVVVPASAAGDDVASLKRALANSSSAAERMDINARLVVLEGRPSPPSKTLQTLRKLQSWIDDGEDQPAIAGDFRVTKPGMLPRETRSDEEVMEANNAAAVAAFGPMKDWGISE